MTRRIFFLSLALSVLAAAAFSTDLPSAWRSWLYSRSIESPRSGMLNYVTLDREVFAHSENDLSDLRVIDDLGNQQPYEVRNSVAPPTQSLNHHALRENSFVPGQFTQLVVDLGAHAGFHDSLRVQTSESDFINWVEVAASDDAHLWRVVKARAPISSFRKENIEGSQTIRYSENNARYLRLRIQEKSHQFSVSGVEVFASQAAQNETLASGSVPLIAALPPDSTGAPSQTRWTVDLLDARIPVAELNFETDEPEFYRAIRISTSTDAKEWQAAGSGEIYRFTVGGKPEESVRAPCCGVGGVRYWRVEILNGSDAPLSSARMSVAMRLCYVLFRPKEGRSYRLLVGNARASAPQYDFVRTLQIQPHEQLLHLNLGSEESTTNYADPRPYTERHPNLLWIALAAAIALLGYAALRAMRTPGPAPQ